MKSRAALPDDATPGISSRVDGGAVARQPARGPAPGRTLRNVRGHPPDAGPYLDRGHAGPCGQGRQRLGHRLARRNGDPGVVAWTGPASVTTLTSTLAARVSTFIRSSWVLRGAVLLSRAHEPQVRTGLAAADAGQARAGRLLGLHGLRHGAGRGHRPALRDGRGLLGHALRGRDGQRAEHAGLGLADRGGGPQRRIRRRQRRELGLPGLRGPARLARGAGGGSRAGPGEEGDRARAAARDGRAGPDGRGHGHLPRWPRRRGPDPATRAWPAGRRRRWRPAPAAPPRRPSARPVS